MEVNPAELVKLAALSQSAAQGWATGVPRPGTPRPRGSPFR